MDGMTTQLREHLHSSGIDTQGRPDSGVGHSRQRFQNELKVLLEDVSARIPQLKENGPEPLPLFRKGLVPGDKTFAYTGSLGWHFAGNGYGGSSKGIAMSEDGQFYFRCSVMTLGIAFPEMHSSAILEKYRHELDLCSLHGIEPGAKYVALYEDGLLLDNVLLTPENKPMGLYMSHRDPNEFLDIPLKDFFVDSIASLLKTKADETEPNY